MGELSKHEAKPSIAGFCYQFTRAITHLLNPQITAVSIETLDDVSYEDGKLTVLEQDKHTVEDGKNVFSNKSKNLLGTLLYWLKAVSSKELDLKVTRFCLVTNSDINIRGFAKLIVDCQDVQMADKVVAQILDGAGTSEYAKELVTFVKENEEHRRLFCELVVNISVCVNEKEEDTLKLIEGDLPEGFQAHSKYVYQTLLGWIVHRFVENVRNAKPTYILHREFITQRHSILAELKRSSDREQMAHLIDLTNEEKEREQSRTFVKQIELVDHEAGEIDEAIVDYLKFRKEKLRLTDGGNVLPDHWIDYFAKLEEHWKGSKRKFIGPRTLFKDEAEKMVAGRNVMVDTLNPDYHEYLAGEQTDQPYMTKGGCHMLSNDLRIGWHPDYLERLKRLKGHDK